MIKKEAKLKPFQSISISPRAETSSLLNAPICVQKDVTLNASSRLSLVSFNDRSPSPSLSSTLFLLANIWQISRKVLLLVSGTTSQM